MWWWSKSIRESCSLFSEGSMSSFKTKWVYTFFLSISSIKLEGLKVDIWKTFEAQYNLFDYTNLFEMKKKSFDFLFSTPTDSNQIHLWNFSSSAISNLICGNGIRACLVCLRMQKPQCRPFHWKGLLAETTFFTGRNVVFWKNKVSSRNALFASLQLKPHKALWPDLRGPFPFWQKPKWLRDRGAQHTTKQLLPLSTSHKPFLFSSNHPVIGNPFTFFLKTRFFKRKMNSPKGPFIIQVIIHMTMDCLSQNVKTSDLRSPFFSGQK